MIQTEHCAVGTKKNDEKSQIKWILSGKDGSKKLRKKLLDFWEGRNSGVTNKKLGVRATIFQDVQNIEIHV